MRCPSCKMPALVFNPPVPVAMLLCELLVCEIAVNAGTKRFGVIRFGSRFVEISSVRFGSVWFGSVRLVSVFDAVWPAFSGRVVARFGSFPHLFPAGSRVKRFGSVRPVRFGFLFLPVNGQMAAAKTAGRGTILATASDKGTIVRVYDTVSGARLQEFLP